MKKKKNKFKKILSLIIILAGLSLLLYVPLSMAISQLYKPIIEDEYDNSAIGSEELETLMQSYNESISTGGSSVSDPFSKTVRIDPDSEFYIPDSGVIGYVNIPAIGEKFRLFFGATDEYLASGLAYVEGSSLPIGGASTRSVISGHRGWMGTKMLINAAELSPGDRIHVRAFGKDLTYSVTGQEVIDPSEYEKLAPVQGLDMLTLLTCTPIPNFDKRLLINAQRIEAPVSDAKIDEVAKQQSTTKTPDTINTPDSELNIKATEHALHPSIKRQNMMIYGASVIIILLWLLTFFKLIRVLFR